ncbi:MAG: bacteriocin-protection protein [Saprospiraceae bacterium]|nr:bacteriocin-protection protein [Saprospiraceae bacterium]
MKLFQPRDRMDWRNWLEKNHRAVQEVWLVYYKKATGKPTISYRDSLEEAICFGWIDGIKKKIDDDRYTHRFSPRKPISKWSPLNIKLARKMIHERKMTDSGLAAFKTRKEYDKGFLEHRSSTEIELNKEIEQALKKNQKAWKNFAKLTPGYKKQYTVWLNSAKRETTRKKRLQEAIELLEKDKKLDMK